MHGSHIGIYNVALAQTESETDLHGSHLHTNLFSIYYSMALSVTDCGAVILSLLNTQTW